MRSSTALSHRPRQGVVANRPEWAAGSTSPIPATWSHSHPVASNDNSMGWMATSPRRVPFTPSTSTEWSIIWPCRRLAACSASTSDRRCGGGHLVGNATARYSVLPTRGWRGRLWALRGPMGFLGATLPGGEDVSLSCLRHALPTCSDIAAPCPGRQCGRAGGDGDRGSARCGHRWRRPAVGTAWGRRTTATAGKVPGGVTKAPALVAARTSHRAAA